MPDALVRATPARLRQVLINLVGNAIKFTERGEVLVDVERRSTGADDASTLRFAVADTGIGIPPDKQRRIFEAFDQADASTTRAVTAAPASGSRSPRSWSTLMGGRIWVESDAGPRQPLPLRRALRHGRRPEAARAAARRAPARAAGAGGRRQRHQPAHARGDARPLAHAPDARRGAHEALTLLDQAAARKQPFPIVLLDANMPELDGFALAERIRRRRSLAATRLLMLTSGPRPGDERRAMALGVSSYLIKPVKQSDLLDRMLEALEDRPTGALARALEGPKGRRLRVLVAEDNPVNQKGRTRHCCVKYSATISRN